MSDQSTKEIQLEIAHVLFLDIVGYSRLSVNTTRPEDTTASFSILHPIAALFKAAMSILPISIIAFMTRFAFSAEAARRPDHGPRTTDNWTV